MRRRILMTLLVLGVALSWSVSAGCKRKSRDGVSSASKRSLPLPAAVVRRLPVAPGEPIVRDALVVLTQDSVSVDNKTVVSVKGGRVDVNAKRDGPDGFFIDPLFKVMKALKRKLRAAQPKGRHCVLVATDRDLSYRLMAEVLYTLNQAEFSCYQLAVNPPPAGDLAVAGVPITTPRLSRVSSRRKPGMHKVTDTWGNTYWTMGVLSKLTSLDKDDLNPKPRTAPGTLARGSAAYKKTLAELTNISSPPMMAASIGMGTSGGGKARSKLSSFVPPAKGLRSTVRGKIRSRVLRLKICHQKELQSTGTAQGKAKISFMIMPNGRVSNVSVMSSMGPRMIACLKVRIRRWNLGRVKKQTFYGPFIIRFSIRQ